MAYGDFKDLNRRTTAEKVLPDKALNIAKNPKYDGYWCGLASMVYIFFDTKTSGGSVKNEIIFNKELAEKLHKPTIRKFEKRKLHSPFIDNIFGTDPADMQLGKFKFRFRFLLCIIDIYSKYAWVFPLKDKKGTAITNAFQKLLDESNLKPIKILVEKGSEFYSRSVKTFLQNNVIKMYSTYNEGKSVIAETFIRTWKNKIYKYMTSVSKKVYIDKLDDIVNKYNNTHIAQLKLNLLI